MDFADLFSAELKTILKGIGSAPAQAPSEGSPASGYVERSLKESAATDTADFLATVQDIDQQKVTREDFRKELNSPSQDGSDSLSDFAPRIVVPTADGDEPFVGYTPANLVALCFSGGGIRSSTFNLGVLQGLSEIGLLPEFDYLSTVSGGGYAGSWWTAWRHRNPASADSPKRFPETGASQPEPIEINRLRQRGNFLSPTIGLFKGEIWRGLFLFAIGLAMTLSASLSLLALVATLFLIPARLFGLPYLPLIFPVALLVGSVAYAFTALAHSAAERGRHQDTAIWLGGWSLIAAMVAFATWAALEWNLLVTFLTSSAVTATAGAIFFKFGNLISRRDLNERPSAIQLSLGRLVPKALAVLGVGGLTFTAAVFAIFVTSLLGESIWAHAVAALGFAAVLMAASIGASNFPTLHNFYRSRIAQTFLPPPDVARESDEGDFQLSDLAPNEIVERPIHLINCCSNEADGDALKRRGRNGMNASISPLAYCVGNAAKKDSSVTLATAVTASAAATNPFMGQYSAQLGTPVSFLMAALNLRLGIWLPDPKGKPVVEKLGESDAEAKPQGWLPKLREKLPKKCHQYLEQVSNGGRFMSELLGIPKYGGLIHLSDGGHFENLGLYEMIRRQCRYILVSDCGADPSVTFSEFAHLQRLVRQDFGVEIDIDLDTLREGSDGHSSQHMVAGTIKYPGAANNNLGILIYVKPTLTGDEPEDVTQYRVSNKTFPHESTADQFYDSAQWESYRQLGYHSIKTGFGFQKGYELKDVTRAPRAFSAAAREWMPPASRRTWDSTKSFSAGAIKILRDAFPELRDDDESVSELTEVLKSLESLEREFENRDLSNNMDHLENWGWVNWGDRLVSTDAICRWWPFVSPLFSVRFRNEMMDNAFGLNPKQAYYAPIESQECIRLDSDIALKGKGPACDRWLATYGTDWAGREGEHFLVTFTMPSPWKESDVKVQLGCLFFSVVGNSGGEAETSDKKSIVFYEGDIQVAPGQWSVGIQAKLLDTLLVQIKNGFEDPVKAITAIRVLPNESYPDQQILDGAVNRPTLLHFFLKRGFIRRYDGVLEKPIGLGILTSRNDVAVT